MKTLAIIICLLISSAAVWAQSPVPEPDTLRTPVRSSDASPQSPAPPANYLQNKIKITSAELPDAVQKALQSAPQYTGWETAAIYKDKAGKVFIIEIREADARKTFRFDESGKPVVDE